MSKISNTIALLKKLRERREAGLPCYLTTDPAWLVNVAINRRAGWPDDPHHFASCRPVNGAFPKKALGDADRALRHIANRVNTPRLVVRLAELGEWRNYIMRRMPDRITMPGDE